MSIYRTFYITAILAVMAPFNGRPAANPAMLPMVFTMDGNDLTVSYSIGILSKRSNTGIAETYNGGVKTLFIGGRQGRLRLVSLMRIQSVFISTDQDRLQKITIVKESGKNKYKSSLTEHEWSAYNKKYLGASCNLTDDTMHVLNYLCKKALITLKGGRTLTAWYTTAIQNVLFANLEPAFSGIPGLVLKYEYTLRRKTISYTATSISRNPLAPDVFTLPGADFPVKKFIAPGNAR